MTTPINHCIRCGSGRIRDSCCLDCGYQPVCVSGFPAFAPDLAHNASGFDPDLHRQLAQLESRNFWFRARNRLIVAALRKFAPTLRRFMEVGCGTGFVLAGIRQAYPDVQATGSELFVEGLAHAAHRLPGVDFIQMDARAIPYRDCFDAIGAFDVIEHIQEDATVLAEMHRALVPGGLLILTVPQHAWLWSAQDVHAHHVRRYTRKELQGKVRATGFTPLWTTSFVTLLLPLMLLSRRGGTQTAASDPFREFRIPRWLDQLLFAAMRVEIGLIKLGVPMPLGGSLILVARKPAS